MSYYFASNIDFLVLIDFLGWHLARLVLRIFDESLSGYHILGQMLSIRNKFSQNIIFYKSREYPSVQKISLQLVNHLKQFIRSVLI